MTPAPAAHERSVPARGRQRPLTVVVADDHPLYRDGMVRAIGLSLQLELVGEAEDGATALALVEEHAPDVALLDVRLPDMDGIALCERIASRPDAATRVLLLSAFLDPALVGRAVRAGAAGYLGKDSSREDICEALARVGVGGTAFSPALSEGLIDGLEQIYASEASEPPSA